MPRHELAIASDCFIGEYSVKLKNFALADQRANVCFNLHKLQLRSE